MAAEGPFADRADVDVDELADGVVAYAAGLQAEGDVAELAGGDAGDAYVDGLGQRVLRVLRDAGVGAAGAEVFVALRSAVAADDVDDGVGPAEAGEQVVEQVEFAGVVLALVVGAVVAEEVVELVHRGGQVGVADAVHDVEAFAGVQVVELEVVLLTGEGDGVVGEPISPVVRVMEACAETLTAVRARTSSARAAAFQKERVRNAVALDASQVLAEIWLRFKFFSDGRARDF